MPTGENAPGERVREAYELLNSWNAAQQMLSDLYLTWPYMIAMCFGALSKLKNYFCYADANKCQAAIMFLYVTNIDILSDKNC